MDRGRVAGIQTGVANRDDLAAAIETEAIRVDDLCGAHQARGQIVAGALETVLADLAHAVYRGEFTQAGEIAPADGGLDDHQQRFRVGLENFETEFGDRVTGLPQGFRIVKIDLVQAGQYAGAR